MRKLVPFGDCATDPTILGSVLGGDSWLAWRACLKAAMGESLTGPELIEYSKLTEREREPGEVVRQLWVIAGRRGGKSRAIAALAIFLSIFCDYSDCLSIGEVGVLPILARDRDQASVIFNYISGILESNSALKKLIVSKTSETISLSNGIEIQVRTASFRGIRGITAISAILDEIAY